MSGGEIAYLTLAVAAALAFVAVLAWANVRTGGRH